LLVRGSRVRATVRDVTAPSCAHLLQLPGAAESLELLNADVLCPGDFDKAAEGCECIFHMAAPVQFQGSEQEITAPAIKGTLNVLQSAKRSGVPCVVLMSSMSAVAFPRKSEGHIYTADDWSNEAWCREQGNWYHLGKTLSERDAHSFGASCPGMRFCAVCPTVVYGAMLQPKLNTSCSHLLPILRGDPLPKGSPPTGTCGVVDVGDVAEVCIKCWLTPTASGRYLCAAEYVPRTVVAEYLMDSISKIAPDFKAASKRPSATSDSAKQVIPERIHSRVQEELGVSWRDWRATLLDTLKSLSEHGHLLG